MFFATTAALLSAAVLASADNSFSIVGDGLVSAQQLFVASEDVVYIVDKTENNPTTITNAAGTTHPAWASEFTLSTKTARTMDIVSNSFCAGGTVLGNGSWINAGGNQAITTGGQAAAARTSPYYDIDGGTALRVLDPCTDKQCNWVDNAANYMTSRRWYPTLETLADGSAIIIGGDEYGGFVNQASQNNPTYEFFPKRGAQQPMPFLNRTMPANLFPLTWLVPSGKLFMQANWGTQLFDYTTGEETALPNITKAVRTYPASGANTMLALTPENNYTATVLFCGGADYAASDWNDKSYATTLQQLATANAYFRNQPNSASCEQISPDAATPTWTDNDDMLEPRSMGEFVHLPDNRLFLLNGISSGVAGYDNNSLPYGTDPIYAPAYFDPSQPAGSRWSRDGIQNASLPRLYHSTASLLADGSVIVAGSNPYRDFQKNGSNLITDVPGLEVPAEWWSETRIEIFYPDYYSKPRPVPSNLPKSISYGGAYYNVSMRAQDLANVTTASDVKAVIIRTGFATHAMNMGLRNVNLATSLTTSNGNTTLHVAPLPANPNVLAPGPAFLFVTVNGVPSNGTLVMIGSGAIEQQATSPVVTLPTANYAYAAASSASGAATSAKKNAVSSATSLQAGAAVLASVAMLSGFAMLS